MALIVPVRGFTPQIGKDCFLAENATIVGDTVIGDGCSIWFNAVLRGDVNWIKIGNHVNIQDGSVLHTLYEKSTITIGDYVAQILVDADGARRIDVSNDERQWANHLLSDLVDDGERLMTQEHVLTVCDLSLQAQERAAGWGSR